MPKIGIGLSFINALRVAGTAAVAALAYITDKLVLYFNFAKEDSADPAYTGHKTVQFGSAGSTSFDGSNDIIQVGTTSALNPAVITVSAWVYQDAYVSDAYYVSHGTSSTNGYHLGTYSNRFVWYLNGGAGSSGIVYSIASINTSLNKWYHLVAQYDGTDIKLFVDGILQATAASVASVTPTYDLFIGRRGQGSGFINGKIANVGIWSRVLSLNEIQAVMRKSYSDLGTAEKQSLEAWWGLDTAATIPAVKMDVGSLGSFTLSTGSAGEMGEGENEKTAVFWMKWDGSSGGGNGSGLTTGTGNWLLYLIVNSNGSIAYYDGTSRASDAGVIVAGKWQMVVLSESVSGGNHSMYVDNVLIRTDSGSTSVSAQWRTMAGYSGRNYGGQFASGAYYDKVLSLVEVQSLYALGRYGDMNTVSNCENFWKFDSVTSITAEVGDLDISTFSNCTLTGGETIDSVGEANNNDSSAKNNGEIDGTTTTVSIYGGNAPKLARTIDVAAETFGDAIGGGSYEFNGSSDYIDLGTGTQSIVNETTKTLSAWVNIDSGTSGEKRIIVFHKASGLTRWGLGWGQTTNKFFASYNPSDSHSRVTSSSSFTAGSGWHHIASVTNGANVTLYIDGVSEGTASDSATSPAVSLTSQSTLIGNLAGYSYHWDGSISNVGVWSRALTAVEIKSVMEKSYSDLTTAEKVDLDGWWGLDSSFINPVVAMNSASTGSILTTSVSGELGEGESQKSMVIWLNWDGVNTSLSQITSGNGSSWCQYWLANGGKLGWYDPGDGYLYSGAGTIVSGQWHMAVLTADVDNDTCKLYIDNALTQTGTNQTSLSTGAQCRGIAGYSGRNWGGKFASAAYYDKVLTLSEVQSLYALGRFGDMTTVANANLQNWWKFDNVTSVADLKGSITITSFTNTVISGETTESVSDNHGVIN